MVVYLHDDYQMAFLVAIVPTLLGAYYLGPTFALTQGLVGLRMRALASSILLFILNLIGLGLGPQVTGILSDAFNAFGGLGTDSLRYALICVLLLNVVATVYYWMAGRDLEGDLARRGELDG
jgi:hypothetical protein